MYDIGIPEIVCTNRYEDLDHKSIKYEAVAKNRPEKCSNADCSHKHGLHIHSTSKNLIRDIRAEGKLVFIDLSVKRYRCPDCGTIVRDTFSFYNKNAHITNRLRDEFVRRCINGETYSYIARDYSVDHKTVSSAFVDYAKSHPELTDNTYTPRILGIDEAHIDDRYRLVLTDIEKQRLLDLKKDRRKTTVIRYLRQLDADLCKCVTMDMAPVYASSVSEVLPSASIVIDKFHLVQEVNRCLDKTRIDIQNEYRKGGIDIRRFKHAKRLFMKNVEDLTLQESDTLSEWFDEFDDLYEAYLCKEVFRDIYHFSETKEDARKNFQAWIRTVPDRPAFAAMRRTFEQRAEHILNYWDFSITNAYTESVNNQIKTIEKAGRGYRFDMLRLRCLIQINTPAAKSFDPKTAVYYPANEQGTLSVAEAMVPYGSDSRLPYLVRVKNGTKSLTRKECFDLYICVEKENHASFIQRMVAYQNALEKHVS